MADEQRPRRTQIEPVPGVTWRWHMGCGALLGFCVVFFGALKRGVGDGCTLPLLAGLGGAVIAGLAAAALEDRFWGR